MAGVHRRKGDIVDESFMRNARMVNKLKNEFLDVDYYIQDGVMYKKLPSGFYRSLVKQDSRPEYPHYFLRDIGKRKMTINANKLDKLTFEIRSSSDLPVNDPDFVSPGKKLKYENKNNESVDEILSTPY